MNFILPMETHDTFDRRTAAAYGTYLCALFDQWTKDDNPAIAVRMLSTAMTFLASGNQYVTALDKRRVDSYQLITIASNGDVGPDDALKPLNLGWDAGYNVATSSLRDFLASPQMRYVNHLENCLPDGCARCSWQNYCRGGAAFGRLINCHSERSGFNNPSVVCEGLRNFFSHVSAYLIENGVEAEVLQAALNPASKIYPYKPVPPIPDAIAKGRKRSSTTIPLVQV